jgi:hypothetical protein
MDLAANGEARPITRWQSLGITSVAALIVFVLMSIPGLNLVLIPLRYLMVFFHEGSHALAALLTGGQVSHFVVNPGGGVAYISGGNSAIILPAGYLGAAFIGATLFVVVNRFPNAVRWVAAIAGALILLFTLRYAFWPPSMATLLGGVTGFVLIVLALRVQQWLLVMGLSVLSILLALDAVHAVTDLIGQAEVIAYQGTMNDAAVFSRTIAPFLTPAQVAFIWAALSFAMMGVAILFGVILPLMEEVADGLERIEQKSRAQENTRWP